MKRRCFYFFLLSLKSEKKGDKRNIIDKINRMRNGANRETKHLQEKKKGSFHFLLKPMCVQKFRVGENESHTFAWNPIETAPATYPIFTTGFFIIHT